MPPSLWDEYFTALEQYLEDTHRALSVGGLARRPARLGSRPAGPLPEANVARWASLSEEVRLTVETVGRRRDEVAERLASLAARGRGKGLPLPARVRLDL
jgi:hypothetical protein